MDITTHRIELRTHGRTQIIDITPLVREVVHDNGYEEGNITVFCPGSTGGVTTLEFEPGLLKDIPEFLESILPYERHYHHHDTWHDDNGSSHVRSALFKPSLTVPFIEGDLMLGTWQQIVFIDFDTSPRRRELVVQIIGRRRAGQAK